MALAIAAEGVTPVPLDVRWNTPTHDLSRIPPDAPEPAVLHYHQEVNRQGLIRLTGNPLIDKRIAVANDAIGPVWEQAAPDATYQSWLSKRMPEAGTQTDNEGAQKIVATLLEALEPASMREVFGVDDGVSPGEADLIVCLDLPTHPMVAEDYRGLVSLLWQSSRKALVVRGYEAASAIRDPSIEFHEPLSVTLAHVAPDAEIYPVHADTGVTTFVALRAPVDQHPRDFLPGTLAPLVHRHPDPLSLITLRLHARGTTRFYPDHAPRLWEYPVAARLVLENLAPGSRLVDIGAGVTPLAPFLSSRGYLVDTVDPSPTIRTWPPKPEWNEWDFLDYGAAGLARRSWNCVLGELPTRPLFDGAYSISVIEHVPATVRRNLLADIAARTRVGGLVVLTIDLVRGGDTLWNLNLEVEVEPLAVHGTLQDVIEECAAVGLDLFHHEVVREWGDSRVDIGLLALRQTQVPATPGWQGARRKLVSMVRRSHA
jgi:hypothetical protein